MWITIEQIQCLQAIRDFGSINAASEHLNKAKSAVSYSINKLEDQIGFPTLDRSQYRIQLTPQGEAFLTKAQTLLKDMDLLKEEVHKIATGIEMKLSLSATAIYPTQKLNHVLRELMLKFPSTEFTFHREILSGEKMLMDESVDIAIFEGLRNTLDIEAKKIGTVKLKLVVCADHPILQLPKKQQTMENLTNYPHIIQRSTIPDESDMGIPKGSKRWSVSDIDSKKDLILNNLGWGRLPDHYVDQEIQLNQLVHLEHLAYDHDLEIFICRLKGRKPGPVLKYLWDSF